ncbi:hypothetical protein IPC1147_30870 [Pseudomonas aeruginosa]|uniref:SprT family zinc-dependent metalloprotease n=1 Tax=Pseudomonas aeruginosa TaxID=287 RepID=UPI000FFEEBE3|nr:SprT-like domain-containing protein [Pseudomonas aeruginosa]MBA5107597.1 SprT-like domain-containing protein [Pseudomonas aeruginosa]MBD1300847.1 SprT-like domain-containing protein [Pseudomonas aeruginosa]MBD1341628.1 SprT-like domain-containing protein [Pseudomonas aeruginosa]MDP5993429.1 SprT-like domain-containing protein [Pseudomonas aeruginosa]RRS17175.1 hypothetical protein IPC1107_30505 [Pseudomonas aeruginosa]
MNDLVRRATEKVRESISIAEKYFSREFRLDDLLFDLKGRAAGQFRYCGRTGKWVIRINRLLLEANPDAVIVETVPHEVAHLVTRQVYGFEVASHGAEWRMVMTEVFGLKPDRCHTMDTSVSSPSPYVYKCACPKQFRLSRRKHNTHAMRPYRCRACKTALVFSHEEQVGRAAAVIEHLLIVSNGCPFTIEHVKILGSLVKGFAIGRVSLRHAGVEGRALKTMLKVLKVDQSVVSAEELQRQLPNAVSHAVFFASTGDERSLQAAARYRERSTVVRVLRHPGA